MEGLIPNKEEDGVIGHQYLEKLVIFSIMWSVGALLELQDRSKMEEFMRSNCKLDYPKVEEGSGDTIFEFTVDCDGKWITNLVL